MEGLLKLNKSKFHNKSIRFVISLLLVSICVSAAGCLFPLIWGSDTYVPTFGFVATIQPLPENHGRWSKEEVDTVIKAIATTAKHHGLKDRTRSAFFGEGWEENEYTLFGKDSLLTLIACYLYDHGASRSKFRLTSKSRKAKGTIFIKIQFEASQITDSDRLLVEKIWGEVLDPLRNKFGERMDGDRGIKIYRLEP